MWLGALLTYLCASPLHILTPHVRHKRKESNTNKRPLNTAATLWNHRFSYPKGNNVLKCQYQTLIQKTITQIFRTTNNPRTQQLPKLFGTYHNRRDDNQIQEDITRFGRLGCPQAWCSPGRNDGKPTNFYANVQQTSEKAAWTACRHHRAGNRSAANTTTQSDEHPDLPTALLPYAPPESYRTRWYKKGHVKLMDGTPPPPPSWPPLVLLITDHTNE